MELARDPSATALAGKVALSIVGVVGCSGCDEGIRLL